MSRPVFLVGPDDRRGLALLTETGTSRMAARARIVLLSEQGLSVEQIASELSIVPPTVYKWRRRFVEHGIAGLYDLPRPGQPLKLSEQRKQAIIRLMTETVPEDGLEWSIRRLAKAAGVTEHQARSILAASRPRSSSLATDLGWPLQLCAIALAPPFVGAAVLVDPRRRSSDAPLGPWHSHGDARMTRARNDPRNLYSAFRASIAAPATRARHVARQLDACVEPPGAVNAPGALELVVAPAEAFAAELADDRQRSARVVVLRIVSVWLRTLEGTLHWLENDAPGLETAAADVKALRACLAQHSVQAPPRNHSEFFWKNPRLDPAPRDQLR